jgi:predicted dehydrogenase
VVCEKPLAADAATARRMAQVARDSGRLAQVCFYYRTWPAIAWARELIEEGAIGRPVHFRGWMLQDYAADPATPLGWRAAAGSGAGALDDLGSHILDVARFLVGDVAAVQAHCRSIVDRKGPALLDAASVLLEFRSGASGVLEASWAMKGHSCDLGFDLVGDEGAIRFSWERANELHVRRAEGLGFERVLVGSGQPGAGSFIHVPGQQMGYRDAFTLGLGRLLTAITNEQSAVSPSFDDGAMAAELVAAIRRASTDRARIEL